MNFLSGLLTLSVEIFSNLNNVPLTGITKIVSNIIEYFSSWGGIAVGIIIFSLILKILPLPLDIYSRVANKKNTLKMEKMRPELERLQRQYANNKQLYSQKMMALYKKEGYSTTAACLPTLVTLVFFIVVISAFSSYSTYSKLDTFNEMAKAYNQSIITSEYIQNNGDGTYSTKTDLTEAEYEEKVIKPAQDAAADRYFELKKASKFLWVQNIWIQDLPWKKSFVAESDWASLFTYSSCFKSHNIESSIKGIEAYKLLTGSQKLDTEKNTPNGYLILVVISIASMLVSQLIMSKGQKAQMELQSVDGANGQAAQTTKMMTWMMPIMFGIFAFIYTASFSLYLIISTLFSTISTVIINKIVEKRFNNKIKRDEEQKLAKRFGYLNNKKEDK